MTWLLEMKNITKTFGAVKAVDNVSLRLNAGEVVSLCGENGSGEIDADEGAVRYLSARKL
ncbi:D-xylose transport ATP-binding protein XylG [Klebsiella pneumoniae]|uniref:D-xylose transport ATP-binding protein XylG n=1 Tax=Klebsiella pneumoniae IS43 TaxID=1432552 RepID=W1DF82_KLEPN|nr:D-xylose transport ATP-binding protein XylG [Klebsiella pneumoniae IS43]STU80085.1 D-xylose transport ATP-binding protein XylG [Klebsiella pneumoniae]